MYIRKYIKKLLKSHLSTDQQNLDEQFELICQQQRKEMMKTVHANRDPCNEDLENLTYVAKWINVQSGKTFVVEKVWKEF